MLELQFEARLSPLPPTVIGGGLVVPLGLLAKIAPDRTARPTVSQNARSTTARAREIIIDVERSLGFKPVDKESEKLGYDIESRVPDTGCLRFIKVKSKVDDSTTITVTKNEILYSLNKPDDYIFAIVEFTGSLHDDDYQVYYVRNLFQSEPDFGLTCVNYDFSELLLRGAAPG